MPNPFVFGGPQNVAPGGPNEVELGDPRPPFAWVLRNPARHGALKLAPGITQPTPIQPDLAHEPGAAAGTTPGLCPIHPRTRIGVELAARRHTGCRNLPV
jgi:hypothetical protein